ncbi:MAG: response regulator [Deltaproteobacteria bacterium]|nr:response regulator [Deltaproteobacteria bacterium]
MKTNREQVSKAVNFQWDMYERFLNIYSILLKLTELFERREKIIEQIPEVLVRGTDFDTCYAVLMEENGVREGFYSHLTRIPDIHLQSIERINREALSPSVFFDTLGYGVLYIHPIVFDFEIKGFIVLGKKDVAQKEKIGVKELEVILGIFNRLLAFSALKELDFTKYLPSALLLLDNKGTIVYSNEKARNLLSSFSRIIEGRKIEHIFPDFDTSLLYDEKPFVGELSFKTSEGHKVYEVELYPIIDKKGKTVLKGMTMRDISALKTMEEESFYREKMETLGLLSAGIAHDFNNLLTGILGYASMLKGFLSQDEKLLKYAEVIERSAVRASNLTKHLLNFSRRQKKPSMEFDLHVILDDSLFLIGESFRDIAIKKEFEPYQFLIKGDESEFQHVFLNLFMNAKDAMEGSGTLFVETKRLIIGGKEFVRVTVEDTGRGMDEEVLEKLFKPYFTTKAFGGHLGLGLYRVEKTVKKYGGFIEVQSQKGKGTRFYVYLPLTYGKSETKTESMEAFQRQRSKPQKKKILVVDDEDFICDMFKHVLSDKFDITCCLSGEEALKEIDRSDFDIIVLDIIMPGIKGDEVLRKIRETGKEVKVIVSSGYMREDQREKIKKLKVEAFLDKPFREEDILRTISKLVKDQDE